MKQIFIATVLALTLLFNSGCFLLLVAGGAVAGTAYVLGELEATVDGSLDQADAAVAKALKKLELCQFLQRSLFSARLPGNFLQHKKLENAWEGKSTRAVASLWWSCVMTHPMDWRRERSGGHGLQRQTGWEDTGEAWQKKAKRLRLHTCILHFCMLG